MGQVQQRILTGVAVAVFLLPSAEARRFYDDDPLLKMPKPIDVGKVKRRKASDIYDFLYNTFEKPGDRNEPGHIVSSQGMNTLGEVPDNDWYTNRHGKRRM